MQEHTSVLLTESVDALKLEEHDVAIDATVGQGGHARAIAEAVGASGTVVAIDADESSLEAAKAALKDSPAHLIFIHGNFRNLREHAARAGVRSADAIIFDLGWHQGQLTSGRGFSFREEAPLLMTLSSNPGAYQVTAADIIAGWDEDDLASLFRDYGGERFSGRIARTIVEERKRAPIKTAKALGDIIMSAVPAAFRRRKLHPATKVFQALRIAVNEELESLEEGLKAALDLLAPSGRLAVISFHSLEDRIVKNALKNAEAEGRGHVISKKPITPGRLEQHSNPRSRSAKLRALERC